MSQKPQQNLIKTSLMSSVIAFPPSSPEPECMEKEELQIVLHNWVLGSSESALANKVKLLDKHC